MCLVPTSAAESDIICICRELLADACQSLEKSIPKSELAHAMRNAKRAKRLKV